MAQTAAHLVDHVIPHVPVRQWVLIWVMRLPIPLHLLMAAKPKPVTPAFVKAFAPTDEALQTVLHKIITRTTQAAHPSGGADRRGGLDLHGPRPRRL